ncbi:efflux RND transporter periplasmic adaptor subunit [Undibacterium arcticum]|uniref:Efflux RND transporter periplasmic adaptor subunit n=1 Tax=Undibacterium arcticum TaxID=1762892 RepID=A0ABV7EZW8_9BURK
MKPENTQPAPSSPTASRKRWRIPLAALILIGATGGGWMMMHAKKSAAKEQAEAKSGDRQPTVFELAAGDVATIDARELRVTLPVSGSLLPLMQTTVKAKVAAEVRETLVQEGMKVTRGQIIARLDSADLRARVATQQAALDEATAKLSLASKNNDTNQSLLKQNYISQNAVDTAHNSVELARASLKSTSSQLEIAQRALDDAVIRAPIDGIVSKRHLQTGDKASPDSALFSIVNLAQLTLEAQVPASEIPRIRPGQDVGFHVDGFAGRQFSGKVARINPTTEAGSRAMLVYVSVPNADGALRGGMFAKGSITTERSPVMPLVPMAALRTEKGQQVVYKIEGGKVVAQPVRLGLRNEDEGYAEVTAGLDKGASVIISKLDDVKPGSQVKLSTPPPAAKAAMVGTLAQKG